VAEDDQHRRVEARAAIPGSGMLTEPDRIRALESEAERRKRAWRAPPAEGFGSVLSRTPPKEHERVGTYVPADERFGLDDDDEDTGEHPRAPAPLTEGDAALPLPVVLDDAAPSAAPATTSAPQRESKLGRPRPNEVQDPRARALHRALEARSSKKPT